MRVSEGAKRGCCDTGCLRLVQQASLLGQWVRREKVCAEGEG